MLTKKSLAVANCKFSCLQQIFVLIYDFSFLSRCFSVILTKIALSFLRPWLSRNEEKNTSREWYVHTWRCQCTQYCFRLKFKMGIKWMACLLNFTSLKKSCCPGSMVYIVVPTFVHMYILIVSNRENRSELTDKIPPGYTYVGWQIKINTHAKIEKLQEWLLS
jgi:hypothetical protein